MKYFRYFFPLGHLLISVLFIGCALALIRFAAFQLWQSLKPPFEAASLTARLNAVLDGIALLTVRWPRSNSPRRFSKKRCNGRRR